MSIRFPVRLQRLIADMAMANPMWGEERIAAELLVHLSSKDSILFEQGDFRTSSRSAKGWDTTASSAARVLKKKLRSRESTSASGMR